MTLYKPDSFHGNHEFKVGFDYYITTSPRNWDTLTPVNYMLFSNEGAPYQFGAINHPSQAVQPRRIWVSTGPTAGRSRGG